MSSSITTILVIGATGGIGESFARRFHSQGKKVIATGRRAERLEKLASELPGLETYTMDNGDLASLPKHVSTLTSKYPDINTVWVNSGIQKAFNYTDPSSSSDQAIIDEVTVNITAPFILARLFIPHLMKVKGETNFMITSSGLAFIPMGAYPVYCPTKAAVHHFMVGLRQQLKDTNVNVIEIDPPRVETDLDLNHKESGSGAPAMSLQEYTDETFKILDGNDAKDLKEVAVGFAKNGADAWRGSIGGILEKMKLGG